MSKTVSQTFGLTVSSEIGAEFEGLFNAKISMSATFEATSSQTWEIETTVVDSFSVPAGATVAVWQYVYQGKYCGRTIEFRSDIFEHTKSRNI